MTRMIPRRDDFMFPVEQAFDQFFSEFFETPVSTISSSGYPKLNASEEDGQLVLTFAVAGMKLQDLNLEISSDNILTISGRKQNQSSDKANYYIRELRLSSFERRLKLPEYITGDPQATLKDGLLTLKWDMPKETPSPVRKITIQTDEPKSEGKVLESLPTDDADMSAQSWSKKEKNKKNSW